MPLSLHIGLFETLCERRSEFTDKARADQLISEGNNAKGRDDVYSLKSVNRELISLLPGDDSIPSGFFKSDVE